MDSYSLKSVSDLPAPFRSIFNFRYFNSLQSECFPVCYHSNVNMKFDAVTRYRIKDGGLSFFSDIALLLIDEVHLLNDPRGAALEAIVSRIKMLAHNPEMKSSTLSCVRFLAVSATIPNIEDIAEWLSVPAQGIKRFGEEMRPVKLTTKVFGIPILADCFSSNLILIMIITETCGYNYYADILMQYSRGKSALVFCSTRKGAQEAAQRLSQTAMTFGYSNPFIKDKEQQERLREASLSCSDKQMQSYPLWCNKEKGLYMEYDRSTILQMCGRAGRPPFDDTGMVIIMTRRETVHLYENLLNGCEMVESQLLSCVTEHLTAEIVQLTVSDIARAIEWMKCSYYIKVISRDRIEKHVQGTVLTLQVLFYFHLSSAHGSNMMSEISVQKVNELSRHQMIWTGEDGFLLKPLEPGRLMTKYYLKFDTMKHIMQTPDNCSLEDALNVICCAEEIAWIQLRRSEKKLLNDINIDKDGRLRFHVNGDKGKRKKRIQTREEKIFVLANDCLTGDPSVHDLSLTQDMNSVCSNGCRIAKCMKEFFIFKKNYKGAVNSTLLAKSLYQKLWDDSPYLLKQLPGIGMVTAKALHSMGIKSFDELAEADPRNDSYWPKVPIWDHIKILCCHYLQNPYSTTVLLSTPKESKLSVKADLIFEEYIGLDFHEKLILLKDNNSGMNYKCGQKQPSLFPPPVEICLIEDDNETISYASAERLCNLKKSKTEDSSMPTFKLIDEELEEGKHPVEIKKDNQKVITKQAIFDHIREKAKNFPILTPAKSSSSPLSEALLFTRKHPYKKDIDLDTELIVIEEIEGSKIPQQIVTNPSSEIREMEQNGYNINNHLAPKQGTPSRSSGTMNFLDYKGGRPSESEKSILKSLTEETIFGHIRERANNFPVLSRTMQSESPMWTKEQSTENQPEFCIAASDALSEMFYDDKIMRETVIISDLEPGGTVMNDCDSSAGAKRNMGAAHKIAHVAYKGPSVVKEIIYGIALGLTAGGLWKMNQWNNQRRTREFYDLLERGEISVVVKKSK
ncbi:hypothetical protein GH714_010237 [Hevea brasiliensis]|uniref:SEC63 domain-containing protein n=1 Tax=Hevea brasiliensis TaxID=3981 RepID=A0A6A6M6P8_HEVBR|nr:hypothetical protein GH714_010237 [Hevea brasiliensis]